MPTAPAARRKPVDDARGTNANDPFAEIVQTPDDPATLKFNLLFKYRTTTGGNITTVSLGGFPVEQNTFNS